MKESLCGGEAAQLNLSLNLQMKFKFSEITLSKHRRLFGMIWKFKLSFLLMHVIYLTMNDQSVYIILSLQKCIHQNVITTSTNNPDKSEKKKISTFWPFVHTEWLLKMVYQVDQFENAVFAL